jgi:hypothetical protein
MKNISENCKKKSKKNFMSNESPPENHADYKIMWKIGAGHR